MHLLFLFVLFFSVYIVRALVCPQIFRELKPDACRNALKGHLQFGVRAGAGGGGWLCAWRLCSQAFRLLFSIAVQSQIVTLNDIFVPLNDEVREKLRGKGENVGRIVWGNVNRRLRLGLHRGAVLCFWSCPWAFYSLGTTNPAFLSSSRNS